MASHTKHKTISCPEETVQPPAPQKNESDQTTLPLEETCRQLQDQLLRTLAEMENQRRRAEEALHNAHKYASNKFAADLLGVKDALEMALADESNQFETLKMGVSLTLKQLVSAFERAQISEINPAQGEQLDPHRHHAISTEASEQEPNRVLRVMQKGYVIADRVLRPAMVIVSAAVNPISSALENKTNDHDLYQQDETIPLNHDKHS